MRGKQESTDGEEERNGVEHIWYEIGGADHDNHVVNSGVFNLFKQIANNKR
ncbi:MAG: hypothetical protein K6B69_04350 [Lachnospiraceae bacterium]|nr:hypothetical protein [Lachnospiraceae bacterium]